MAIKLHENCGQTKINLLGSSTLCVFNSQIDFNIKGSQKKVPLSKVRNFLPTYQIKTVKIRNRSYTIETVYKAKALRNGACSVLAKDN